VDYKYKLETGRLISTNLNSSASKPLISSARTRQRRRMPAQTLGSVSSRPVGEVNAWIVTAKTPLSSSPERSSRQKISSLWHDPEPEMKVVDVQSDSEFLGGLDGLQSDYTSDHNRSELAIWHPKSTDLHLRREQPLQSQPFKTFTKPKSRNNSRDFGAIEQSFAGNACSDR
jgi:hypothetical protein